MAEDKNKKKDSDGQVTETPDGAMVVRTTGRDFRVEGNDMDGYIGVDPEYRTYANSTERPYISEEEVKILVDSGLPTDVEQMTLQNARRSPSPVKEEPNKKDDSSKDDKSEKAATSTRSASTTGAPSKAAETNTK